MKALKNIILFSVLTILLPLLGCDKEGETVQPSSDPATAQVEILINGGVAWQSTADLSVMKDGYDVSDQFDDFKITFSENTFETENALPNVWPNQGSWVLDNNDINKIIRGDGVEMQLELVDNILTLTFQADAPANGRSQGVAGEYKFVLSSPE